MAQDTTQQQEGFIQRWTGHVNELTRCMNALAEDKAEWDAMGYAGGAPAVQGTSWNIGDAQVQAILPGATAAMVNSGIGAVEAIRTTYAANTGYLYPVRRS
jgi:hypothetical protein